MFRRTNSLLWFILPSLMLSLSIAAARADDLKISSAKDAESGFEVWTLKAGSTELKVVPEAGANPYSLKFEGRELLRTPKSLKELPGFMYGNPILYPMPNRVRNAAFTFGGKEFKFPANNKGNFLHGLVHSVKWEPGPPFEDANTVVFRSMVLFKPGSDLYKQFPFHHSLQMTYELKDGSLRLHYRVTNEGTKPLPFGFAFHPWFLYLGERANTYLTIPATHHMEAPEQLPTGKLEELTGSPFDARQPHSLKDFLIDDVYYGLQPDQPVVIDHRDARLKVSLQGTKDFTHLVVYTPKDKFFCVENQTCSTDAHNLHAKGFVKESHLQIVQPGKHLGGAVEIQIKKY